MSPSHTHDPDTCPAVREVLNRIGDKWSVLVVHLLGAEPKRFNALKRQIEGISQRMLTLTLRGLERDGLVSRHVEPTVPPRVEYALTELGRTLLTPVQALAEWAIQHRTAIHAAQQTFDRANEKPATKPIPVRAAPLRASSRGR